MIAANGRFFALLLAMTALAAPTPAGAGSLCDHYRSNQPELYKLVCSNGSASTKPAGANSTFTSAFNLNSASLPTEPSSYGLETLINRIRDGGHGKTLSPTFSIVKGFRKFGTGISTGSNATFYGDDIVQRLIGEPDLKTFDPVEPAKGSLPNLNVGTSLGLYSPARGPNVRLGLSARYNAITESWGGGPALLLSWPRFSFGAGTSREKVSNSLPRITFLALQASVRVWLFEFEYDHLSDDADARLDPIHIFTATLAIRRLLLTAAERHSNYLGVGAVTQRHFAVQYLFSRSISAGFLFNYVPGANSVGLQYFL